jgi:tRNA(Leu) C34 or U34 (ribose-2'-O)-methylase TrmL
MRGYFGIGVEGLTKPMNAGNLFRSAHAFGASFVFTLASNYDPVIRNSDTSDTAGQVPFYSFASVESMRLPEDCTLVGVELADDAIDLPSFRHPRRAAYVLGMERGSLSPELIGCCDHVVRIPTCFSLNLASAGAIVMYDRVLSMSRFGARPVAPGGPVEPLPAHRFGDPVIRRKPRGVRRAAMKNTADDTPDDTADDTADDTENQDTTS